MTTSAVKAVTAEVWKVTHSKRSRLNEIVHAWREMALATTYGERRSLTHELNSAYARNRFKSKGADDPVYLAHYDIEVKKTDNKHCKIWARIPYKPRQPLWLPLRMSDRAEKALLASRLRDSRLIARNGRYWMHFTVTRDVTPVQPRAVLAVDLGEKRLSTTVLLDRNGFRDPRFYGQRARGIRRHYAWLRRQLGERKLLRTIRKVKDTERRKVNTLCHQISHAIVEQAKANGAAIVLGDLKGIRARDRGKRLNRIVASMPYDKLSRQIEYKAAWEGVTVFRISERGTSKTCHRCGSAHTKRLTQPIFECLACGLVYNADLNGTKNIAKRAFDQWLKAGAVGSPLITLPERSLSAGEEEGSQVHVPRI